jgi:hypothetical protein
MPVDEDEDDAVDASVVDDDSADDEDESPVTIDAVEDDGNVEERTWVSMRDELVLKTNT